MTDQTSTSTPIDLTDADVSLDGLTPDADWTEPAPFTPNYTPLRGVRILRQRLYADEGGVATARFDGTLDADAVWVDGGSLYAEVRANRLATADAPEDGDEEPVTTVLRVALVPTGKRVPEDGRRLGRVGRGRVKQHAYLLGATTEPIRTGVYADSADDGLTGADAHLDDLGD